MTPEPVVCFILKGFPRISETFISNEILGLERLGFKIRILSMRRPREAFAHGHIKQIQARVDYLPSDILPHARVLLAANIALALRHPCAYGRALKQAGIRWLRTRKSATLKHLLQAGYLVRRCLPGSGIVHFHAHFAHSPASVALFAGMLTGIPFSFFAHAKDIYTQDRRQLSEKIGMAAFVATCTQYNLRHLKQLAPRTGTPIDCVYHGINLDYFRMPAPGNPAPGNSAKPVSPANPYRILTVARHVPKKGLDLVVRAMGILRDMGLPFSHTIIGDGDLKAELGGQIRSLGLSGHIRLMDAMPHEQVIDYYRRSHLFIIGCRIAPDRDRDGIPNVIAEAMAMGVPVVAPDVSGIPELLVHDRTGIMVPTEDPRALALAARRLLTDQALRTRITRGARKKVDTCFNAGILIHDLARLYRKRMELQRLCG